jgi:hypothetical protein
MPSYGPSVMPTNAPSDNPTVIPSNLPSNVPSVTSPCSIGKVNVLGSHFIYIDEDESFVDEDDLVCLAVGIPARYTLEKIWPSDAETETGYYIIGGTNEFWIISEDTKQECTQKITGCFPWSRIRTQELMGLTTVTDPAYYEEVEDGVYFHNIMTFELSEEYDAPDGWAKPEDTSVPGRKSQLNEGATIERKVIYDDFLTVTSLVSQKLIHPCLRGSQRPDDKTLSTFPSLFLLLRVFNLRPRFPLFLLIAASRLLLPSFYF